jgi:replicative DNA helicase
MGKTALALNVAVYVARRNVPVVFFSLEMSDEQLALRAFSDVIGVPSEKMRSGRLTQEQIDGAVKSADVFADVPLFIDQAGGISIAQLTSKARRLKRKHGIGLIVVDYLQLMQASKSRGNRVQDITEITVGLKALAKELRVPVLALSQLSRSVEQRENKRPQLADLRESGSIEQDADIVLFVYREEYYLERAQPTDCDAIDEWQEKLRACSGKAEIIIGKQRHGPLGIIPVAFDGQLTRFSNLAREAGYDRS